MESIAESNGIGYWGNVDSLQDWCEPNYVVTFYIAEFFNTLSSLPMVLWCIFGIYYTHKSGIKEARYILCFAALGITGIGSSLFHGTLRYYMQLMDELPMMIANMIFIYTILESNKPTNKKINLKLITILTILCMSAIYGYVYLKLWFLFLLFYGGSLAIQYYYLYLRWDHLAIKYLLICIVCYYGGLFVWIIDLTRCEYVQSFHFHSIWHIGAGYGTYLYILTLVMLRVDYLKKKHIGIKFQMCPAPLHIIVAKKHNI
eukprot:379032_1